MEKVGRNTPCPCGNGKKYKHCHGSPRLRDPAPLLASMQLEAQRRNARTIEIERQFGKGRPPIAINSKQGSLVAVGPELHWQPASNTFADFLMRYFQNVMGSDWGQKQLSRPAEKRHPLIDWFEKTAQHRRETVATPGVPVTVEMCGATCGTMYLAFGLYLLRHNAEIQTRLLERLRADDPAQIFAGVYEVSVAATFIWAGFKLQLEDEADGQSTHCEFTATSPRTGRKFSVEAKVCSPADGSDVQSRSRVPRQLARALAKKANHTRIVMIDLNCPMSETDPLGEMKRQQDREINRLIRQERAVPQAPPAYVVLTNFPYRYHLGDVQIVRGAASVGYKMPKLSRAHSLRELGDFREAHADLFSVVEAFNKIRIPDTLDGSVPARAFNPQEEVIEVGKTYRVPGRGGEEVDGLLEQGFVDETNKSLLGVFSTNEGQLLVRVPLTEHEMAVYQESPETFLGVYQPNNKVNEPIELYEWLLAQHRTYPRSRLEEMLGPMVGDEALRQMSTDEIAKHLAEGYTLGHLAEQRKKRAAGNQPS